MREPHPALNAAPVAMRAAATMSAILFIWMFLGGFGRATPAPGRLASSPSHNLSARGMVALPSGDPPGANSCDMDDQAMRRQAVTRSAL